MRRSRFSRAVIQRERDRSRRSRVVISLVDSARAALVNVAQNALVSGVDAKRWGNAHPNLVPYQLFRRRRPADRHRGRERRAVARVRARHRTRVSWPTIRRSPTNAGRLAQRDRIVTEFSRRSPTEPAAVWRARLDAAGVPNGVVQIGARGASGNEWLGGDGNAVERRGRHSLRSAGPR